MKKKMLIIIPVFVLLLVSIYVVYALTNKNDIIKVTKTGETAHGNYELDVRETNLPETSGYLGVVTVSTDSGYYVKNLTVTYDGDPLELGFEAGSEHGNFFRPYSFSPMNDEYQFLIPQEVVDAESLTDENKIQIVIEYAKKSPVDITYANYTKNTYEDDEIGTPENYSGENVLVSNYMDGDIVLPDDCTDNGCLLKFQFKNHEDYEEYKNTNRGEEFPNWIFTQSRMEVDGRLPIDTIMTGNEACNNEENYCYAVVRKEFKDLSQARFGFGYTDLHIYSTNFIGFGAEVDVDNFSDILRETGADNLAFNSNHMENDVELFYGTKVLKLNKTTLNPIVNEGTNNSGTIGDFDNITGSGYGYSVTYNNGTGVATVAIDSYYQDQMTLELTISKNGNNVLPGKVKINLHRFAFSGNGGELLLVDSIGRNCRDNGNNNTCSEGEYYSTQYRGVLSAFYVNEGQQTESIDIYDIDNLNDNEVNLISGSPRNFYKRNKNFTPHAIALFYNNDDMIVKTKDFNLNDTVLMGGLMSKETFNELYGGRTINYNIGPNNSVVLDSIDKDYVFTSINNRIPIKYIEYFDTYLSESIMHDLVLISKAEARELGIVKIALFLVNGEVEEEDIPALTFGTGEGKVMYIREED